MHFVYETTITIRNLVLGFAYRRILKPIFFAFDPENVHDFFILVGRLLGSNPVSRLATSLLFNYKNPTALGQKILGIEFPNPIGLAAGFDKNARLGKILPAVGFGFIEFGSITGETCPGNDKPRIWRLKKSQSLVVNYGLPNDGAEAISARLTGQEFKTSIGISIAKTNSRETVETKVGIVDYAKALGKFIEIGNYLTINISCPNSYGGEPFTDPTKLDLLLDRLETFKSKKPIFLKLSPDLSTSQVDAILAICSRHRIDGFICGNLTKNRNEPALQEIPRVAGGLSGRAVSDLSDRLVGYIYKRTVGKYILVGCGGIFTAEDAYFKIRQGASLLQLITGMIFEGPQLIGQINQELVKLLRNDGFENISEAVGANFRL
ncbi:MAG: quinone-dependent dihydroorotate dehydrogenase [Candidatus Paceibacterota bacterium]|jgi:dihydroorotate dehydrogenase